MFSGLNGYSYFGPAEIDAMRRAQKLVDRALRAESVGHALFLQKQQAVARIIVRLAAEGLTEPLALSAQALRASRLNQKPSASFRPYERRPVSTRIRISRLHTTRKIA